MRRKRRSVVVVAPSRADVWFAAEDQQAAQVAVSVVRALAGGVRLGDSRVTSGCDALDAIASSKAAEQQMKIGAGRRRRAWEATVQGKAPRVHTRQAACPEEQELQAVMVLLLYALEREGYPIRAAHVPNEGRRTEAERRIQARMGLRLGFPDLIVLLPGGRVLLLEVKSAAGGASDNQKRFAEEAGQIGHPIPIVRTCYDLLRHVVGALDDLARSGS